MSTQVVIDHEAKENSVEVQNTSVASSGPKPCASVANPSSFQMQVKNQFLPSIGHPLQTNWQFWHFQRQHPLAGNPHQLQPNPSSTDDQAPAKHSGGIKKESYREQLKALGVIPSIEYFFNYYVYMKKPSEMPREIDLFFFRNNEVPMWEESPLGGIWIIKIKKDDNIDKMWESILFALIGEQFEEPKVIGASISLRTKERLLQVWLKDGRNEKIKTNVSNKIRHFLNLDPTQVTFYFKEHQKSIQDGSTMKNAEGFKFMRTKQADKPPTGASNRSDAANSSSGGAKYNNKGFAFGGLAASNEPGVKQYRAKAPSHV